MNKTVLIVEQGRIREVDLNDPMPLRDFLGRFNLTLQDGIRTAKSLKVISKTGASKVNLRDLEAGITTSEIAPGAALIVGERSDEEIAKAQSWLSSLKTEDPSALEANAKHSGVNSDQHGASSVTSSIEPTAPIDSMQKHYGTLIFVALAVVLMLFFLTKHFRKS